MRGGEERREQHLSPRGKRDQGTISEKGCSLGLDVCFTGGKVCLRSNTLTGVNEFVS